MTEARVGNGGNFPALLSLGAFRPGDRIYASLVAEDNLTVGAAAAVRPTLRIGRDVSRVTVGEGGVRGAYDATRARAAAVRKGLLYNEIRIDAEQQGEILFPEMAEIALEYLGTVALPVVAAWTYDVLVLPPAPLVRSTSEDYRGFARGMGGNFATTNRNEERAMTPADVRPGPREYFLTTLLPALGAGTRFFPSPGARGFSVFSAAGVTANFEFGTGGFATTPAAMAQNVVIGWQNATSVVLTSAQPIIVSERIFW